MCNEISNAKKSITKHSGAVRYWTNAAREQSRWALQLKAAYKAESHGKRRGRLWLEGLRCRQRVKSLMIQARRERELVLAASQH